MQLNKTKTRNQLPAAIQEDTLLRLIFFSNVSQQSAAATGEKIAKQRKNLDLSSQRQQQQERENCKTERESRSFASSYRDVDSKRRRRTTTTTTTNS
jgi:hypothetical protein